MQHTYFVKGMHCASCELMIERQLLEMPVIKAVDASTTAGQVIIQYEGSRPSARHLSDIFHKEKYQFFDDQPKVDSAQEKSGFGSSLGVAILIVALFIVLSRLGFSGLITVTASSSLPAFFVFGLLAGLSSCAALVGGIVLSMSKQWSSLYAGVTRTSAKFTPHFLFNIGRLLAYFVFGSLLGWLGQGLQLSLTTTSILVLGVSVLMVGLALQMLGVNAFKNWQIRLPKRFTRSIANETNFSGRYMPFILGALTFFLPCGFTITAQGLALLSGSALQGGLIMLAFALGTMPMLLVIGFSSVKLTAKPHLANRFLKTAGLLVLFFALYNINAQLGVLGVANLQNFNLSGGAGQAATEVSGVQVIKMNASVRGYEPASFTVKANVPVRWEITDTGTSGCTNAVISRGLFNGAIQLTPGETAVKEFTPTKPGRYIFSCWMGMVSGNITVLADNAAPESPALQDARRIFGTAVTQ